MSCHNNMKKCKDIIEANPELRPKDSNVSNVPWLVRYSKPGENEDKNEDAADEKMQSAEDKAKQARKKEG